MKKSKGDYTMTDARRITRKTAHPGKILKQHHFLRSMLPISAFSALIGLNESVVTGLMNEQLSMTPEIAEALSIALKTTPELWMNLQKLHDETPHA